MARMASLTTDENGVPLTDGSNFTAFCTEFCRKSPIGRERCEQCDKNGAVTVLETGKPTSYFCHANLVDFAALIMLGYRMIGSFIGGQVLDEEPDLEKMREVAKEYIRQIRASGKNLLTIINDILDFSKIESGKMNIVEVVYEPLSIINSLSNIVNTRIVSKKLEFTVNFDAKLPHKLYGDNIRVQQILLNLLNNAVKFTEKGEVHLSVSFEPIDSETIMLKAVVRDTGIGIKKQDFEKLFQSFQQVDSKRNRNIEGTGLGLAISQQLLRLMDGSISVESEYEKGSAFYVNLPQKIIDPAPSIPVPDSDLKAALIIEDEYVLKQICKDLSALGIKYTDLEKHGNLESVTDGYIIVKKHLFGERIKKSLADNPRLKCLLIAPFESAADINTPRVKMLHKPVF